MTYVTLFPQLIAGPIVRYTTVQEEMDQRTHSLENFAYGVNRFIIGLSKKVLLANTLGELGQAFAASTDKSVLFYWIMTFAFMLHVYFDFSGYSDMAIGMGRMFGFHFLENFNYPFIAKSIAEFWRRWHISLGTWFRDYVYIPMGGNRVSGLKWVRNTLVVWFLTGFWHGAQWNFVVWGLYFSITLALEKFFIRRFLDKLPAVIRHLYTLFFITLSFVLFNANSMGESLQNFMGMFGLLNIPLTSVETLYFLRSYGVLLIIGVAGATPLMTGIVKRLRHNDTCARILNIVEPILHVVLLLLVTGYMIDGSFNPFIYFRF
jgi:alginate O-acetyltransferase complex protein AlgI